MRQRKQPVQRSCWTKAKEAIPKNEGRLGGIRGHERGRSMPVGHPFNISDFMYNAQALKGCKPSREGS